MFARAPSIRNIFRAFSAKVLGIVRRLPKLREEPGDLGLPELTVIRQDRTVILAINGKKYALLNDLDDSLDVYGWANFIQKYPIYKGKAENKLVLTDEEWFEFKKQHRIASEFFEQYQKSSKGLHKIIFSDGYLQRFANNHHEEYEKFYNAYKNKIKKRAVLGKGEQGFFRLAIEIKEIQKSEKEIEYQLGDIIGVKKTKEKTQVAEEECLLYLHLDKYPNLVNFYLPVKGFAKTKNSKGIETVYQFVEIAARGNGEKYLEHFRAFHDEEQIQKENYRITKSFLAAMSEFHQARVYHRDIKLENLLFDETGNLKIADFGCAYYDDDKFQDGKFVSPFADQGNCPPEWFFGEISLANRVEKRLGASHQDSWATGLMLLKLYGVDLSAYSQFINTECKPISKKISKMTEGSEELRALTNTFPEIRNKFSRLLATILQDPRIPAAVLPVVSALLQVDSNNRKSIEDVKTLLLEYVPQATRPRSSSNDEAVENGKDPLARFLVTERALPTKKELDDVESKKRAVVPKTSSDPSESKVDEPTSDDAPKAPETVPSSPKTDDEEDHLTMARVMSNLNDLENFLEHQEEIVVPTDETKEPDNSPLSPETEGNDPVIADILSGIQQLKNVSDDTQEDLVSTDEPEPEPEDKDELDILAQLGNVKNLIDQEEAQDQKQNDANPVVESPKPEESNDQDGQDILDQLASLNALVEQNKEEVSQDKSEVVTPEPPKVEEPVQSRKNLSYAEALSLLRKNRDQLRETCAGLDAIVNKNQYYKDFPFEKLHIPHGARVSLFDRAEDSTKRTPISFIPVPKSRGENA